MKVLMIEYFYPENTYTQDLGKALAPYVDLTIACKKKVPIPQDGLHWKRLIYEGYHSKFTAPILYAKSLLEIGLDIWKNHYDVVHIQYMRAPNYEIRLFRLLRRRYGLLADTIHTLIPHEATDRDRALHRSVYGSCDLLVVHNQTCREQLIRDYGVPEERICVMPHGSYSVASEQSPPAAPEEDGPVRFLMFGQLRKYKGVDVLLEAAAKLPEEYRKRIRITIAGPHYRKIDDTDYEAMARELGVEDCVTLIPRHIPVEEHAALFADADVCVFPYKELYGSGALIMAYAFEKPVLVSEDPIFREETEDGKTGLLFSKNDPQALADAMVRAANWKAADYERFREHIRWMNRNKFSWEKSAKLLFRAYQTSAERRLKSTGKTTI